MNIKRTIISLVLFTFFIVGQPTYSQPPLPSQHGEDGNQETPIGGGFAILLTLVGAYGAKKVYNARKKIRE